MAPVSISIDRIHKTFKRGNESNLALNNLSLEVGHGEMIALIGASGSGKSTLLRHVAGLIPADKGSTGGSITVDDNLIQKHGRIHKRKRNARADTAFIFQQFNLVNRLSVLTNVCLGLLGRIPPSRGSLMMFTRAEKMAAMEALDHVGMERFAGQRASTLSGGQQQRVAIARALVQKARLVLADEPIASLDPASSKKVMQHLSDLNKAGKTVLVSLHQVNYALRYCTRTIAMRDGELVFDGPSNTLTNELLADLYGDDSEEFFIDHKINDSNSESEVTTDKPFLTEAFANVS